jgi:hypothetical protein
LTEWYFDIETEGTDPQADRILTIQYQSLEDGAPRGAFQVFAEWEWGEKEIVRQIVEKGLLDPTWDFVPVGNRLKFDITFIMEKAEKYDIKKFTLEGLRYYWFNKPLMDIAPVVLLMNGGRFAGSSISRFSEKRNSSEVPRLFREGRYPEVIEYITREKDETLALIREAGSLLEAFGVERSRPARSPTL